MSELDLTLVTYVKKMNKTPLLPFEKERELSGIIQSRRNIHSHIKNEKERETALAKDTVLSKAINELTTSNLRLVIKEAFKFSKSTGVDVRDLIGSGNVGLMKSAYLYDAETHNTRFSTYSTYWIREAMFDAVHGSGAVTVPIHILNGRYRHNKLKENDKNISDKEVMNQMKIDENQLKKIKEANYKVMSLDMEIKSDSGEHSTVIGDLIADTKSTSPFDKTSTSDGYDYLYEALAGLDTMSRDIITAQILQDDKIQLKKLGEKYGKTGERIRQIREKALKKLRKRLKNKVGMNKEINEF